MTTITIRADGDDRIRLGLNQYATTIEPTTREKTYAAIERASKVSPAYLGGNAYDMPLPPSGVDVRTGAMGSSVQLEQDGLSSRITVNAYSRQGFLYSVLALGDAYGQGQGKYFQHWIKLADAVQAEFDKLAGKGGELDTALQDSANELGF